MKTITSVHMNKLSFSPKKRTKARSHSSSAHSNKIKSKLARALPFSLLSPRSVVVARGLALRVEETRPVLGLKLLLKVPVDENLQHQRNETNEKHVKAMANNEHALRAKNV